MNSEVDWRVAPKDAEYYDPKEWKYYRYQGSTLMVLHSDGYRASCFTRPLDAWSCRNTEKPTESAVREVDFKSKPNQIVIDMCKDLLEQAESGAIQGVMVACIFDSGSSCKGWAGLRYSDRPKIIGELFMTASAMQIEEDGVSSQDINYE